MTLIPCTGGDRIPRPQMTTQELRVVNLAPRQITGCLEDVATVDGTLGSLGLPTKLQVINTRDTACDESVDRRHACHQHFASHAPPKPGYH